LQGQGPEFKLLDLSVPQKRVGIFVLFFSGKALNFSPELMLTVGLLCLTSIVLRYICLYLICSEFFHESMLSFSKAFMDLLNYVFCSVNIMYHIYRFVYVEPSLRPWDEFYLVIVNVEFSLLVFCQEFLYLYLSEKFYFL
jgi:hypothetical protein